MNDADTHAGADAQREPDWSFSFREGERGNVPVAAVVDELEFAKATLQHELAGVARTGLHLQSLMRRAHADGMSADELAVHSGLDIESVSAVLAGVPLVDRILGAARPAR